MVKTDSKGVFVAIKKGLIRIRIKPFLWLEHYFSVMTNTFVSWASNLPSHAFLTDVFLCSQTSLKSYLALLPRKDKGKLMR